MKQIVKHATKFLFSFSIKYTGVRYISDETECFIYVHEKASQDEHIPEYSVYNNSDKDGDEYICHHHETSSQEPHDRHAL